VYKDAEVTSIQVEKTTPPMVAGMLKNNTTSPHSFEMAIDFADEDGSHIGSDTCTVDKAAASAPTKFTCPLKIPQAVYAQVRSVRTLD